MDDVAATLLHVDTTASRLLVLPAQFRRYCLVLEWCAHGVPWLGCSFLLLITSYAGKWNPITQWKILVLNLALIFDLAVIGVTKLSVQRARPRENIDDQAPVADRFSFPSGHSSRAAMLLTLSSTLCPLAFKIFIWFPFVLAYTRVAMGRHFISDVIAGLAIGWLEGQIALFTPFSFNTFFQKLFR